MGDDEHDSLSPTPDNDARADADAILPEIYDELRRLARTRLARLPPGQTLQTTGLVHEALLRLGVDDAFDGRAHLFFAAARAMRDVLVQRAREKATLKRGADRRQLDLDVFTIASETPPEELLALDEAIEHLDENGRHLVELRFHAGFTMPEISQILNRSLRDVERSWRFTRARLYASLRGATPDERD